MVPALVISTVMMATAPATGGSAPISSAPAWLKRPSPSDLEGVWPAEAFRRGVEGRAKLDCTVSVDGLLVDCKAVEETPPGLGFGPAALLLAPRFLFRPASINGVPSPARVVIPIAFKGAPFMGGDPGFSSRLAAWEPWSSAPTEAEVASAYPASARGKALVGHVTMICRLDRAGTLHACVASSEQPEGVGFAQAALGLAPKFKVSEDAGAPGALRGLAVTLAVQFIPPSREKAARYLAQVDWLRTAAPGQGLFPAAAAQAGVTSGVGVVDCLVGPGGNLQACVVADERPAGLGFGAIAVRVATAMRANLWTRDGFSTLGAHVKLPVRLDVDASSPPKP